ncbi:LysR family transcriptional regulator [Candidimonas humi]|uniref:LysR family transcriptional regulator n=1 Tax=Candidimonas humi TaxID=683355 RepID=A0ABV8NXW1_9BURK|nr:LysR family transcriptional regulator [Candidimonas humi]MBV6304867.1 LysR family transcriptional regulator [Candidimonas humi]
MDELTCLRMFLEVARRNSFAGAAQHFGVSRATCSKQIAWLEKSLGVKLLNRTTKQLGLTPAGLQVLENGSDLVQRYDDMHESVSDLSGDVAGVVRVGVPPSFGTRRLLPVIKDFHAHYPDVQIAQSLLTVRKHETFIEQGLDVGIIIVPVLKDASFIAIPLAEAPQALVASPAYLASVAPIQHPRDLMRCKCLVNWNKSPTGAWNFTGPEGPVSVRVQGPLRADFGDALKEAALAGMGISMHPYYMLAEEIEQGKLQVVLPRYEPPGLYVYAIYSSRKNLPMRVQVFLDFLKAWAKTPKSWDKPRTDA